MKYFIKIDEKIKRHFLNNKGQGLIEYAWILILIAVLVVVMLEFTGNQVENKYIQINSGVTSAMQ
jgi:Flp pilus assembly pilin Flp